MTIGICRETGFTPFGSEGNFNGCYCLGGTISAIFTAITKLRINNLVLATVPIDFSIGIVPDKWLKGLQNGVINFDRFSDVYGAIPSEYLYLMFRGLSRGYVSLVLTGMFAVFADKWLRTRSNQLEEITV